MTVHLTEAQEDQLNVLAMQSGNSVDVLAQSVVDQSLLWHKDFIAAVKEGLAESDRGELVDHAEVMQMMDEIIANG